jgi:predicted amidophosphoribosyltransferase
VKKMEFRLKKGEELIEGVCVGRYYPKRFKVARQIDELSRELWWLKKHKDDALIGKWGKALAFAIRETDFQFDFATIPPASKQRLYYFCRELASVVAVELGLELVDCLQWAERVRDSQGKRRGALKLKRFDEPALCNHDMTGLRVLLIDDLLTTGLTAYQCIKALKSAGAQSVFVGILGWTRSEDKNGFKRNFGDSFLKRWKNQWEKNVVGSRIM